MISRPTPEQEPSPDAALDTAAAALAAAQQAVSTARRNLGKAIVAAREAGHSVPYIARHTGLDNTVVRNILAATPPAAAPAARYGTARQRNHAD